MTDEKRSNLPWILAGCGVLLLFGCCLSTAGGVFFYRWKETQRTAEREAAQRAVEEQVAHADQQLAPMVPDYAAGATPSVTVMATVTRASGARLTVRTGEPCEFQIEYPERTGEPGQRWCHTIVRCGGIALYGGGTGGYFPCTFSQSPAAVRGTDSDTTHSDRDGAFTIDTAAGTLQVRDDSAGDYGAFEVDATITRTR